MGLRINDGIVIDYTAEGWSEFKKWLDGTNAYLPLVYSDLGPAYDIVAIDGKVYRTFSINKADATDFETNFKSRGDAPVDYVEADKISIRDTCKESGSSDDLTAFDGSSTPVVFTFDADSSRDIRLHEVRFVFSATSTPFAADKFGPASALTTGLLLEIIANGQTTELANIKINEDFISLQQAINTIVDQTGEADFISAGVHLEGLSILRKGSSDKVRVTVRDDLASITGLSHLKCYVYGVKDQ